VYIFIPVGRNWEFFFLSLTFANQSGESGHVALKKRSNAMLEDEFLDWEMSKVFQFYDTYDYYLLHDDLKALQRKQHKKSKDRFRLFFHYCLNGMGPFVSEMIIKAEGWNFVEQCPIYSSRNYDNDAIRHFANMEKDWDSGRMLKNALKPWDRVTYFDFNDQRWLPVSVLNTENLKKNK
jgi:hypothetical protein